MELQTIIVRYGEIYLKGKNRGFFEKALKTNIARVLEPFGAEIETTTGRLIITNFKQSDRLSLQNKLSKVAGVYSISPAYEVDATPESILEVALSVMKNKKGSFRVTTKRADKTFPVSSMDFSKELGGRILSEYKDLSVDLHNPNTNLEVDIRVNHKAYVFTDEIFGVGGMPVGTAGRGLLLLSGGIDSPVAGYMMAKRGLKLTALHFESFPYTSPQAKEKAIELATVLAGYNGKTDLYVCNIAKIQEQIHEHCHPDYMITLVRRFMLRIAEKLAEEKNIGSLVSGESLAQVASQTLESMTTIGAVLQSGKPFFKPLIGFDKIETIRLAEKIGSYDISIRPYDDCCTVFLPDSPVIKPKLQKVLEQEARLDVDALVEECFNSLEHTIVEG